jgi:transposase
MTNTTAKRSRKAAHGPEGEVSTTTPSKPYKLILLGTDTHGQQYTFARKIDNQGFQPTQELPPQRFLGFLQKQLALAERVVMVYEAGPYGYDLYRRATELGVECLVCAPENLGRGRKRVNDKIDARELLNRLDRHLAGNDTALHLVRPPTVEQEMRRRQSREREVYRKERGRWMARGRSLLHSLGVMKPGKWWDSQQRARLLTSLCQRYGQEVHDQVRLELDHYLELMLAMEKKLAESTAALCSRPAGPSKPKGQKPAEASRPKGQKTTGQRRIKGIGVLSEELIGREIIDWNRFGNRRQVASFTGLCPGVSSTGQSEMHLSIDKHGNPRLRAVLTEIAWLLPRFQPNYIRLRRWKWVFDKANKVSREMRKKAVVALARVLVIDLWRIHTGRTTPQKLGLVMVG